MTQDEFTDSVKLYAGSLWSHAFNFTKDEDDANDLVQDTLLKAMRFAGGFSEGTNLKGWLFVIMRNTFINTYRKNLRIKSKLVYEEEITSAQLAISAVENDAVGNFAMGEIQKALRRLPDGNYVPFIRYFEGYKYEEIAKELKLPLGTVKTRIHQARILLKKQLKHIRKI